MDRRVPLAAGLVRYVVVGGFSFAVDVGTLWFFHGIVGISLPIATALAFGSAFLINFYVNRAWTFGRTDSGPMALVRYIVLVAANLVLVEIGVNGLVALGLDYRISRAICTAALVPVNFLVMRAWVFGHPPVVAAAAVGE